MAKNTRPKYPPMPKRNPLPHTSIRIGETALRVLSLVLENKNPYRISKILNLHKSTINGKRGHLIALQDKGLVIKEGHKWKATELGFKVLNEMKFNPPMPSMVSKHPPIYPPKIPAHLKDIRAHAYQISLILPRKFNNWLDRLQTKNINYEKLKLGQYKIVINNFKVWLCKKSIVVFFPAGFSYFEKTADEGKLKAINTFLDIIKILTENLGFIKSDFALNNHYEIRINKQHYAQIKNELAQEYNKHNKKLNINDKEGKLWLLIDNSFNLNELETVNNKTAVPDMDKVVKPFFNDLRENPNSLRLSELTKSFVEVLKLIKEQSIQNKETAAGLNGIVTFMASQLPKKEAQRKEPEPEIKPLKPEDRGSYFG